MTTTLDTAQAARCLGVPIDTVERWVRQGKVPAWRKGADWSFDATELKRWARASGLPFEMHREPAASVDGAQPISVVQALGRGGVHCNVDADTVDEVLDALARRAPVPSEGREELLFRLREREKLSSTGIGHGVAVPHPREPLRDLIDQPSVTACFLSSPVDFDAIDGQPVKVALLLLSPDVQAHLRLLSRVAFCLRDEGVASLLTRASCSSEEFMREIAGVEAHITS